MAFVLSQDTCCSILINTTSGSDSQQISIDLYICTSLQEGGRDVNLQLTANIYVIFSLQNGKMAHHVGGKRRKRNWLHRLRKQKLFAESQRSVTFSSTTQTTETQLRFKRSFSIFVKGEVEQLMDEVLAVDVVDKQREIPKTVNSNATQPFCGFLNFCSCNVSHTFLVSISKQRFCIFIT